MKLIYVAVVVLILSVCVVLSYSFLRISPSLLVRVIFTDEAKKQFVSNRDKLYVSIVVYGVAKDQYRREADDMGYINIIPERIALVGSDGVAQFKSTPYGIGKNRKILNDEPRVLVQASSFDKSSYSNRYRCSVVSGEFREIANRDVVMKCDIL